MKPRFAEIPALHGLLAVLLFVTSSRGEDTGLIRPYIHFRSAEFNTAWDVKDGWGFGAGVNLNEHWGVELALENYELDLSAPGFGDVGEQAVTTVIPQVRFRYPLGAQRKWVPYAILGVGFSALQFNDRKPSAFHVNVDAEGYQPAAAAGIGLEYFLADNITFSLEGKYLWSGKQRVRINGMAWNEDFSAPVVTMGLRAYFRENRPRPLVEQQEKTPARFYAGARFGGSVLTDKNWGPIGQLAPENSAVLGSVNHFGGLALGANVGDHLGFELAMDFTEYTIDSPPLGEIGEYSVYSILPLLRLRWPVFEGRLVPYLMMGAGLTYAEFNDRKTPGEDLRIQADGFNPAAGLGGGVEYFFTRKFSMNSDVRWLHTWNHELQINGARQKGNFSSINFFLGFRVYLLEL